MQKRETLELDEMNPPFKIRLTSFFKIYMLAGFGLFASMTIYLYLRFGMSNVLFILFICDAYFFLRRDLLCAGNYSGERGKYCIFPFA